MVDQLANFKWLTNISVLTQVVREHRFTFELNNYGV